MDKPSSLGPVFANAERVPQAIVLRGVTCTNSDCEVRGVTDGAGRVIILPLVLKFVGGSDRARRKVRSFGRNRDGGCPISRRGVGT